MSDLEQAEKEKILFNPDSEEMVFEKIDKFKDFLQTQDRKEFPVEDFKAINFSKDSTGKFLVDFGSGPRMFTPSGFSALCSTIKVPNRFITKLPHENMCRDLTASLFRSDEKILNFITSKDNVIGVSTRKVPVSTLEVLEKLLLENGLNYTDINYHKGMSAVSVVKGRITCLTGDEFDCGVVIQHDDCFGDHPRFGQYIWRLICTNGARVKTFEKTSKFSNRLDKTKMFDLFSTRLTESMDLVCNDFVSVINRMTETKIPREDKRYLKAFVSKKLGHEEGGDPEYEMNIHDNDDATYYSLMNYITDYAKNFEPSQKNKYELLGGNVLSYFKDKGGSHEILPGFSNYRLKQIKKEINQGN